MMPLCTPAQSSRMALNLPRSSRQRTSEIEPRITPTATLFAILHSLSSLRYVFNSSAEGAVVTVTVGVVAVVDVVVVIAAAAGTVCSQALGLTGSGSNATYAFFQQTVLLMYRSHRFQLS